MIKKAVIVNVPRTDDPHGRYLNVEFTDGTCVSLDEKELKNAAAGFVDQHIHEETKNTTIIVNGYEMIDCAALYHDA